MSFLALLLLLFLTEKELERVIENKGGEFRRKKNMEIQSGSEKMRNASAQQGAASKVKMSGGVTNTGNMNTGNEILGKHIWQFLPQNNV